MKCSIVLFFMLLAGAIEASSQYNLFTMKNIFLKARPAPIGIDPQHTAVIVVDMQNAFGAKGGMLDRAGVNISMIQKAIAPTARVLAVARKAGIPIVYLKMGYLEDLSDLGS